LKLKRTNKKEGIPGCVELLQETASVVVNEVNIPLSCCLTEEIRIEEVVEMNIKNNVICW